MSRRGRQSARAHTHLAKEATSIHALVWVRICTNARASKEMCVQQAKGRARERRGHKKREGRANRRVRERLSTLAFVAIDFSTSAVATYSTGVLARSLTHTRV